MTQSDASRIEELAVPMSAEDRWARCRSLAGIELTRRAMHPMIPENLQAPHRDKKWPVHRIRNRTYAILNVVLQTLGAVLRALWDFSGRARPAKVVVLPQNASNYVEMRRFANVLFVAKLL